MRLVVDIIRGLDVDQALNVLKYTNKEAAKRLEKLVLSASFNWQTKNEGVRVEESGLYIKEAFVDSGRMLKRFQPAPMGRAHRIRKRSNHVTIVVDSKVPFEIPKSEPVEEKKVEKKPKKVEKKAEAKVEKGVKEKPKTKAKTKKVKKEE